MNGHALVGTYFSPAVFLRMFADILQWTELHGVCLLPRLAPTSNTLISCCLAMSWRMSRDRKSRSCNLWYLKYQIDDIYLFLNPRMESSTLTLAASDVAQADPPHHHCRCFEGIHRRSPSDLSGSKRQYTKVTVFGLVHGCLFICRQSACQLCPYGAYFHTSLRRPGPRPLPMLPI